MPGADKLRGGAIAGLALSSIGGLLSLLGSFLTWDRPLDSEAGIFDNNVINIVHAGGPYFYLFFVPILAALVIGLTILCGSSRSRSQGFGISVVSVILFAIILFYHIRYSLANYQPQQAGPFETFLNYLRHTTGIMLAMLGTFLGIVGGVLAASGLKPLKEGKLIIYEQALAAAKPTRITASSVRAKPIPYTPVVETATSHKFETSREPDLDKMPEEIPPPSGEEEVEVEDIEGEAATIEREIEREFEEETEDEDEEAIERELEEEAKAEEIEKELEKEVKEETKRKGGVKPEEEEEIPPPEEEEEF